jgi:hypothetical protein
LTPIGDGRTIDGLPIKIRFAATTLLAWGALTMLPAAAQAPAVESILEKAAEYVAAYKRDFVGVVADETYRQDVRGGRIGTDLRGFPVDAPGQKRELKSDVLLVRAPDGDRWMQFRDVFEVDGKPVRDRTDRLTKLFLRPSRSVDKQIQDIATESARYNIGGVNRTINLPVFALTVLEDHNRPWFVFEGSRKKDSPAGPLWDVDYREERGGTLIRTNGDESMPVHGRFSVEAATGRVLSSELLAENAGLKAQIDVTYAMEPSLGMLVPREMREKYTTKNGSVIQGKATYARFRRYQVTVDEKIK